jgi:hypothetical protein
MVKISIPLVFVFIACQTTLATEAPLNLTVTGQAKDKVELENYSATPSIPTIDDLPFSPDGGQSAMDEEIEPFLTKFAALMSEPSKLPFSSYSTIPSAPYIIFHHEFASDPKKKKREKRVPGNFLIRSWEFRVVDDLNNIWHSNSGDGNPPDPLVWEGTNAEGFILDPNRTYYSFLLLKSVEGLEKSVPGEASKFLCFIRNDKDYATIRFGSSVYDKDKNEFSKESDLYLRDLVYRLSQITHSADDKNNPGATWNVVVWEPAENESLGQKRLALWKRYLEKALGHPLSDDRFKFEPSGNEDSSVSIVLNNYSPPATDLVLNGGWTKGGQFPSYQSTSLIGIKEVKDMIVVDMRYDQIFRSGSGYIKDEALPVLSAALVQVRKQMGVPYETVETIRELPINSKEEGKKKNQKKILLRSFIEKVKDNDQTKDDPKLTALRSKILFMLFARAALLPSR